jgi:hypothetical protein
MNIVSACPIDALMLNQSFHLFKTILFRMKDRKMTDKILKD